MKPGACFVVVFCCFIFDLAEGAIRHVPSQYQTVQAGINASVNGDTILVAEGRYYENIRFMGKAIIVASDFLLDADTSHVSRTIIDGSNPPDPYWASVVRFDLGEDTTSVLCGFTITGGKGSEIGYRAGGGILCTSNAKIEHNIIRGNTLDSTGQAAGGGIYCSGEYCIIENNRIESNVIRGDGLIQGGGIWLNCSYGRVSGNVVSWNLLTSRTGGVVGGGIYALTTQGDTARVTIIGNRIEGNVLEATQPADVCIGGGIFALTYPGGTPGGTLILEAVGNNIVGNTLRNNLYSSAGGISIQHVSELSIIDKNRIIGNTCTGTVARAGGVLIYNSRPTVTNNVIAKNRLNGSGAGGGIRLVNDVPVAGRLPLINNTIAYNTAPVGAGIYSLNVDWLLMNSIVWHDTGGSDIYPDGGSVSIVFSNTEEECADTGDIHVPPGFVDTLYRLPDTSHCIGAGTNSFQLDGVWYYAPPGCINGNPRPNPQGSRSDMGACESPLGGPTRVWETPLTEIPQTYALEQNYPNPFNPSTTIQFTIPVGMYNCTSLRVYDVLGREVATLVNNLEEPGYKSVRWNASGMASGVYFYRLQVGSFSATRRLMVVK